MFLCMTVCLLGSSHVTFRSAEAPLFHSFFKELFISATSQKTAKLTAGKCTYCFLDCVTYGVYFL